jgi:hypothetical protein
MALENNFIYMIVDWYNQIGKHLSWWFEHRLPYVQESTAGNWLFAQEASVLEN